MRLLLSTFLLCLMTACGGGGGGSSTPAPPIATGSYIVESTTISQNTYPTTYNTVTTVPAIDDTCLVSATSVQYPASYQGAFALPAIPAGQTLHNMKLGVSIKDNWAIPTDLPQDNPNINIGCNTSNRTAFLNTLAREKSLGAAYVNVPQFACLVNASDPTIPIDTNTLSIPDADITWMGQQAAAAGMKIRLTMQVCSGDQKTNAPITITSNTWLTQFFATYTTFMMHEAQLAQAAGYEAMSIDWSDWSPDLTNYISIRNASLAVLATNIRTVFGGKLWLIDSWDKPSTDLLNSVDFVVAYITTPAPKLTTTQNTNLNVAVLKSGFSNVLSGVYNNTGTKPVMLMIQIQSHRDYFLTGWVEDSGCWVGVCASSLTTDFSVQALGYEAVLESIHDTTLPLNIESINVNSYWLSDTITPHTSYPNTSHSVRNKPAEAIIYNWFKG
jgi:hypothetical protein